MIELLEERIVQILTQILGETPAPHQFLAELQGWDSLCAAEFIIALQKTFAIRFQPAELADIVSLERACFITAKHLQTDSE